jgi:hypothetical protein
MTQGRPDAPASYTIRAEPGAGQTTQDVKVPYAGRGIKAFMIAAGVAIAAMAMGLILTAGGLRHANAVNSGQASQIRALNQANARMSLQISQMTATLSGQNPASDTDLITCGDLRGMGLVMTTGAAIEAGGSIGLSQIPVSLPKHCAKR